MKLQRTISVWSGIVSILSLIFASVFNYLAFQFLSNIFIGLFSSGILICGTSIAAYFSERNNELTALFEGCFDFMKSLVKNVRKDNQVEIHQLRDNLESMRETYNQKIFFRVNRLEILNHDSKAYKIVSRIWWSAASIYGLINEDLEIVSGFILGDVPEEEIRAYQWKSYGNESIELVKKLQSARNELADYLRYDQKMDVAKKKRREAVTHAD